MLLATSYDTNQLKKLGFECASGVDDVTALGLADIYCLPCREVEFNATKRVYSAC